MSRLDEIKALYNRRNIGLGIKNSEYLAQCDENMKWLIARVERLELDLSRIRKYRPDRSVLHRHGFSSDLELAIAICSALEICIEISEKALAEDEK